jgi:hypothetical protein
LARHWPDEGGRHDAALALAGGLARDGWREGEIENFRLAVAEAAGDEEADNRTDAATRTVERVRSEDTVTGRPTLAEQLGKDVVDRVRTFLAIEEPSPTSGS